VLCKHASGALLREIVSAERYVKLSAVIYIMMINIIIMIIFKGPCEEDCHIEMGVKKIG
jgi:hypothetical protein